MKNYKIIIILIFSFINIVLSEEAQIDFVIKDFPNDAGDKLLLKIINFNNNIDTNSIINVYAREKRNKAEFQKKGNFVLKEKKYVISDLDKQTEYEIYLASENNKNIKSIIKIAQPKENFFNTKRINVLIAAIVFTMFMLYFLNKAKKGYHLYIRPINGLQAIDDAIGRATEMGKPILYVPGLSDMSDIATIASLTILEKVAQKTAEYDTPILVPTADPIVMTVAQEVVKEAFLKVGKPDAYDPNSVFYVTSDQFGFVAGVSGIMTRIKPAANFFLGMFWAESLILAETGNQTGAIQISGTDAVTQIPFFITSCDYTLIGEELYAASAYLSHEPNLLSTLKTQGVFKAVIIITVIFISFLLTVFNSNEWVNAIIQLFSIE